MFTKRFFYACAGLLCLALAYQLGVGDATAKPPLNLDVATLTGVLNDGETIPLPAFADGTTALESECRWTVSMNRSEHVNLPEGETCYTEGRVVRAASCASFQGETCVSPRPQRANYMIIAVRKG